MDAWAGGATRRRKARAPFVILGIVVLVAGLAIGVLSGLRLADVAPSADEIIPVTSGVELEIELAEGDRALMLYLPEGEGARCGVTGPDGEPTFGDRGQRHSFTFDGVQYHSFLPVGGESRPPGTWTVSCEATGSPIVAPQLDTRELVVGIVGIILAVFALIGGVLLLVVVGLRRSARRDWRWHRTATWQRSE